MQLRNRIALVTGGTSGIGLELARRLMASGNTVIVTGRDPGKLATTRASLPGVHTIESDVADPGSIVALHARIAAEFPRLDLLVNNAGIMRKLDLQQPRGLDDLVREIDINLGGTIRMVQQFLPLLSGQKEAAIVNVSSGLAYVPLAIAPVYSATKAAIHAYTQSLRLQLRGTRVAVIELAPPGTDTPLFSGDFTEADLGGVKSMPVDVLVSRAIRGIERGHREIRPGLSTMLWWMSRIAPRFIATQLGRNSDRMR